MLKNLAIEYFSLANGITAFHVVQTILFLSAIPKEPRLLSALCRHRRVACIYTWVIAIVYCGLVIGCGVLERSIYLGMAWGESGVEKDLVLSTSLYTMIGRILLICFLSFLSARLTKKHLRES